MTRNHRDPATAPGVASSPRFRGCPLHRAVAAALLGAAGSLACAPALAQEASPLAASAPHSVRLTPSIGLQETFTNNVNLTPVGEYDWVTEINPGLSVNAKSAHSELTGSIALPVVLYARTGSENNSIYPSVNLNGFVDLYERIFKVEGAINVSQQFYSPFAPTPPDLANATDNRYRSTSFRVSPVLKGTTGNGVEYELRNDNTWTNLTGAPISTDNSYYTTVLGRLVGPWRGPWQWRANYEYTDTRFNNQQPIQTQIGRAVAVYRFDPQFEVEADVGYESNDYILTSSSNVIYGVGLRWHPTPRTDLEALWEHRFFGSSYQVTFKHHTGLTVWNIDASRNVTTYPQQIANLAGGTQVASYLDQIYQSTIPDPVVRQETIDRFISERGLPATLTDPVALYTQQIQLQTRAGFSTGWIGARNSVLATIYYLKTQPISATGEILPPLFAFGNDSTQTGFGVTWTNRLEPLTNLVVSVDGYRTVGNGQSLDPALNDLPRQVTRQGSVRAAIERRLSLNTSVFAGGRYQRYETNYDNVPSFNSNGDYREAAGFVGINYSFR